MTPPGASQVTPASRAGPRGDTLAALLDRSEAGPRSSAAWRLGIPVRPYVWRRNDPERDTKIAAEWALAEKKKVGGKASAAARRVKRACSPG